MSGFSRSIHSTTCSSRARIPLTFHVTTFIGSGFQPLRERARELWSARLVLVLEEDVGRIPLLGGEALRPGVEVRLRVILAAEAEVTPLRGGHERRRALLVVRDAQGRAGGAQERVHVVVEP